MKNLFLVILIGLPFGIFAGWESQEIYKGLRSNSAVANDFDGDGNMEVIFSIKGQTLLSSLDGKRRQQIATYVSIHSALVDFDNDGDLDYIGASRGQLFWLACPQKPWEQEWVFHNISTELQGTHAVDIADVDGDGFQDVIAGSFLNKGKYGYSLCWFKNPGDKQKEWAVNIIADKDAFGGLHYFDYFMYKGKAALVAGAKGQKFENGDYFAMWVAEDGIHKPWKKQDLLKNAMGATHAFVRDLTGDGNHEFIFANGHGVGVHILPAVGEKTQLIDSGIKHPHSLDVGDMDGDGDIDILTCGYGSQEVVWYENLGSLKFKKHTIGTGQEAYDVRIVDLDGDGHKDVLVAGRGSNNVIWYKNPKK